MNIITAVSLLLIVITSTVAVAQEKTTQLREVVVTATKTEKDPNDVTQPVSIISGEEIRKSGATDVPTAIQNATGVHIGNYGTPGSVQSLSIQGAFSSQILVLVDGIRMNSSRDGGFDLSMLPISVEDIERIEIVRGPGSALYGSDAVGGVVNIITKKPIASQNTFQGSAGSNGYDDLYLRNTGRYDQFYYALSGERETSDGYRVNSDLDQWVYGGKMGYDISKTSFIEVSANFLENEVGSPGSTTYPTPHARQRDRNGVFSGVFKMNIVSSLNLKLSGYSKKDNLSFQDPDALDFLTGLPAPISSYYVTKSKGGEAQLSWLIADWNQLVAGYEIRKDSLDSSDAQAGSASHSASLDAYYFQDEISIGEPLIIVLGIRRDDHSVYGKKSSPKASARYYFKSTDTILRASYGESFRAPTFNDLYFNTSWGVGNPNLRPESAKEYEGGIEQRIGKSGVLKFSGFDRKVTDMIQWVYSLIPMQPMQVENIGKARIRGYAAEGGYNLPEAFSALINYTYTNPVDETTGEKIYTIPKSEVKGILTFFPEKTVYMTLQGRAVYNYVAPGEPRWQYSVMDVKIAEKMWKTAEFFILAKNVFDRNYEVVKGYPMAPQEFFGGITAQF